MIWNWRKFFFIRFLHEVDVELLALPAQLPFKQLFGLLIENEFSLIALTDGSISHGTLLNRLFFKCSVILIDANFIMQF